MSSHVFISSASLAKRSMCVCVFDVSWHQHKNHPLFPCHGFFAQANLENAPHQRDRKKIETKLHQPVLVVLLHLVSLHPLCAEKAGEKCLIIYGSNAKLGSPFQEKKSRTLMKLNSHLSKKSTKQEPTNKHLSLCKPYSI